MLPLSLEHVSFALNITCIFCVVLKALILQLELEVQINDCLKPHLGKQWLGGGYGGGEGYFSAPVPAAG